MSLAVIVLTGDQQVRTRKMPYNSNGDPVHLYLSVENDNNFHEFSISIVPETQQISTEFLTTSNIELQARQDEFKAASESVARMPIAIDVEGNIATATIKAENTPPTANSSPDVVNEQSDKGKQARARVRPHPPRRGPRTCPESSDATQVHSSTEFAESANQNSAYHTRRGKANAKNIRSHGRVLRPRRGTLNDSE